MHSPWDRDVSWLINPQEESRVLEPKIRAAISMAWLRCSEISRKYLHQEEPLQEPLEQAIVRLHQDLVQAPTLPDAAAAEMLVKHYVTYTRQAAARERNEARRFVVLAEVPDPSDIESVIQVHADLATVLQSVNPDECEIIVLRRLHGKTWKQVATQMGLSDVAARLRYRKAMQKLQHIFSQLEH